MISVRLENTRPTIDPSATRIIGLNSELEATILDDAGHELARVDLPKKINVEVEFARATIALDEKNHVRDVRDWDQVRRYVGGISAYAFWRIWGTNLKVS